MRAKFFESNWQSCPTNCVFCILRDVDAVLIVSIQIQDLPFLNHEILYSKRK